jgi:hypothetical protein
MYPGGGLLSPGKISTFPRNVSQTSNPQPLPGSPKWQVEDGVSRWFGIPCCGPAGQLSAMNSCQANAAACSGVAAGAPPAEGGPAVKGGLSSFGTGGGWEGIVIFVPTCACDAIPEISTMATAAVKPTGTERRMLLGIIISVPPRASFGPA